MYDKYLEQYNHQPVRIQDSFVVNVREQQYGRRI